MSLSLTRDASLSSNVNNLPLGPQRPAKAEPPQGESFSMGRLAMPRSASFGEVPQGAFKAMVHRPCTGKSPSQAQGARAQHARQICGKARGVRGREGEALGHLRDFESNRRC